MTSIKVNCLQYHKRNCLMLKISETGDPSMVLLWSPLYNICRNSNYQFLIRYCFFLHRIIDKSSDSEESDCEAFTYKVHLKEIPWWPTQSLDEFRPRMSWRGIAVNRFKQRYGDLVTVMFLADRRITWGFFKDALWCCNHLMENGGGVEYMLKNRYLQYFIILFSQ